MNMNVIKYIIMKSVRQQNHTQMVSQMFVMILK